MSAVTPVSAERPTRLYDVDWLRVIATLTIIAFHCSRFFDTADPWHVKNNVLTDALTIPFAIGGQFMMPLFFLLSGISTYFALGARSLRDFAWRRVQRLALPVVTLGWFVASPPQVYIERVTGARPDMPVFRGSFWAFLPHYFQGLYDMGGNFALTGMHLWYLSWLLVFTLLGLPLFLYLRRPAGQRALARVAGFLSLPGAIFVLGLPMCLPELLLRPGQLLLGGREAGWALGTDWVVFVYGFLLVSDSRLRPAVQRQRWASLGLALLTLVPLIAWAPGMGSLVFGSRDYALQWGWRTVNGWLWVLAIVGFAARYLNVPNRLLAVVGEAVLPFYILHQPVIVIIGYFIRDWAMGVVPKYLLLLGSVLVVCAVLYLAIIRRFKLTRLIFGMSPLPAARRARTT